MKLDNCMQLACSVTVVLVYCLVFDNGTMFNSVSVIVVGDDLFALPMMFGTIVNFDKIVIEIDDGFRVSMSLTNGDNFKGSRHLVEIVVMAVVNDNWIQVSLNTNLINKTA